MKSGLLRGSSVSFSSSRRALVQPRFLAVAMTLAVGGVAYLATAQTGRAPVTMTSASSSSSASSSTKGVASLSDIPGLIDALGQSRQKLAASASSPAARVTQAIGTGQSGYNLVESDLTPNSPSDEREPVSSPNGDFIAFTSNGKDTNLDGFLDSDAINSENRTHIWVMSTNGTTLRQVTGLYSDKNHNQAHPAWSSDGNDLVYIDDDGSATQIYTVAPFDTGADLGDVPSAPARISFFSGTKKSPVFDPSGLDIVFASNANLDGDAGATSGQFDLFSIPVNGDITRVSRLTGGSGDPVGNTTDDYNPAFSAFNQNVLYWSSNRTTAGKLTTGRRIWQMTSDGSSFRQISDPTKRAAGTVDDQDDYPTASLTGGGGGEQVAFQSNSYIDTSDTTHDLNIWSLSHSTAGITLPFSESEPRVFVSDYNGGRLVSYNPLTGQPSISNSEITGLSNPEGVIVDQQYVYIANRGTSQLLRYNQETGAAAGTGVFANFSNAGSVPQCSGMAFDGQYFYVCSGLSGGATKNTTAVYRIDTGGNVIPYNSAPAGTTGFSNGESAAGAVTDGAEGVAISPDGQYLFVSILTDSKINVYDKNSGLYLATVADKTSGLSFPTGIAFGPDLNGDGYKDIYVNSSGSDSVLAYAGYKPNSDVRTTPVGGIAPGTFIGAVVVDNNGIQTNLNAPEGIRIIDESDTSKTHLFVSSYQNRNSANGDHINRYTIDRSTVDPAVPATQTAAADPRNPGAKPAATYITVAPGNNGNIGLGYFDFNALANASLKVSTNVPTPTNTPVPQTGAAETANNAVVLSNIISSPKNYQASGLIPSSSDAAAGATDIVGEDKANDREPAYSRKGTTTQLAARFYFASNRKYAPSPSSNTLKDTTLPAPDKYSDSNKPAASNPYGANGDGGTHDIWGAAAQDTTPPALIPQAQGNQLYPFIAPSVDAPFPNAVFKDAAPRTYEAGLQPGGKLHIGCVFSDLESGLSAAAGSVTVSISRAGSETFTPERTNVDEAVPVRTSREAAAKVELTGSLQTYDDGPLSSGGHEVQAGAVAGDGIYYCDATLTAPAKAGDFYISVTATDQRGNAFTYDNVWGFSTQQFNKISTTSTLFVSDYTCGQQFPLTLRGANDSRFVNMVPCESYYLSNPGGQALDSTTGAVIASAVSRTFDPASSDIWRTLSRGPVPQSVLDTYRPTVTLQIDPNERTPGPNGPYTAKTAKFAVAKTGVVWAAPYAGTVFAGPGTIVDSETQTRLKSFLSDGGRLFITGRDIAYALTDDGNNSNDFLNNELGAQFGGETQTNVVNVSGGDRGNGYLPGYATTNGSEVKADYYNLQIPRHNENPDNDTYLDAALSQSPGAGIGASMDVITPNANGATLSTNYTTGAGIVGQTVLKTRTSGIQSRVVYFSFGFEGVNRRYRVRAAGDVFQLIALDVRSRMADSILSSFRTGSITGTVINDKTNQPIPGFLVTIPGGPNGQYLARTDANGQYTINGVTSAGTVAAAYLLNGKLSNSSVKGAETSPPGFFGGSSTNNDLRMTPFSPGSVSGQIVSSEGTPTDFTDDVPDDKSNNVAVLIRSVDESSSVVGGGHFAKLTRTDNVGKFSFSGVPADIDIQVIVNPVATDIPAESGLRAGYSGPSTAIGRRILPDNRRPDDLQAPSGDNYVVNDPDPTKYPDPDKGPVANGPDGDVAADSGVKIVVPQGPSIRGIVTLDGTPAAGATVDLLDSQGNPLPAPRSRTTGPDGSYLFADVLPGTYNVRATASTKDGVTASQTQTIIVKQGVDFTQDIPILLSDVSGNVTLNGANAGAGTAVTLYNVDGTIFIPTRKATTDASGAYKLTAVPNGKYRVNAFKDQNSGSSAIITINNHDVTGVNINMINRQLSGVVQLSVDGGKPAPLQGARVELVTETSKPLNPPVVVTTDKDGVYSITENATGRYRIIASYGGDSLVSGVVTVQGTATNGPALTLALENLSVKVIDNRGKSVSSASLQLLLNNVPVETAVADGIGTHTFALLPAGTYTVSAAKGNLGGSGTVNVKRLKKPALLTIMLGGDTSGSTNPTGFNVKGKIYYISIPYEDTNSPASSNVSEKIGKMLPATTKVRAAFTVPPVDPTTGQQNYLLQRYDPLSMTFVDLDDNASVTRGVGYLLQVINKGTSLVMPETSRTRIALTDSATEKTFTVVLHLNPSVQGNIDNGRNLIGFGFNPDRYSSVSWTTATFKNPNGQTATSLQDAVNKGWVKSQISTLDSSGAQPKTVNASALKPFGGYFVQTKVDGLQVTFNNPTKN